MSICVRDGGAYLLLVVVVVHRRAERRGGHHHGDCHEQTQKTSHRGATGVRKCVCDTMDCCGVFDAWSTTSLGFIGAPRRAASRRTAAGGL